MPVLSKGSRGTHSMLWKSKGKGPGGQLLRPLQAQTCVSGFYT